MRDLNFFEDYIEKREFKIDKKLMYFTLSSFVVLSLISYIIYNSMIIKQETQMVENLRSTAENTKTVEKVESIKAKEVEVAEFKESVDKIKQLDKTLEGRDIIDEQLLDMITSRIPEDLFLTSLSIQGRDIQIVGIANDKWSVAELQKGLEDLPDIEENFVSNISLQEDNYSFNINITLKDVSLDGEESEGEGQNQN